MAQRERGAGVELTPPRLRILFVGHRLPPDGTGGYELHCEAVRRHLEGNGHRVRVLVGRRGPGGGDDPAVRRSLRWLAPGIRLGREEALAFEDHNRAELVSELDSFAPDVVCWWRLAEGSLSLVECARRRGIPALGYVGDGWLYEAPARDPWEPFRDEPLRLGRAARWVFNSEWLRDRTRRAGIDLERSDVLDPGVDLATFAPGPARAWNGSLLYAGRLTRAKGVDLAVRALARLPTATLVLAGSGKARYVGELERLAAECGVGDRLDIRGPMPREDLARCYRAADAVLFPVRWEEPFGLVPLEAMACGTPVIAVATGGAAEYLRHGDNALTVAREDSDELASAVTRLAGDPGLRGRLRAGGLTTARRFDARCSDARLEAMLLAEAGHGVVPP